MRLAVRLSRAFQEPIADLWPRLTEAEARLQEWFDAGEPGVETRLDYWLSRFFAGYLTVHGKRGSSPVRPQQIQPNWTWGTAVKSEAEEIASAEAATTSLRAFFKRAAKRPKEAPREIRHTPRVRPKKGK